ncbi:hypothetical protein [Streptococcus halichoeri]|uniref:hypothetical protein n=1 Tax=Streptococcus halichoeri TaxID=254785 RepID=UPI0013597D4D|nr:hypothetical protein [Streptococcus halichoeri]
MKTLKKTVSTAVAALVLAGLFSVTPATTAFANDGNGNLAVRSMAKPESAETDANVMSEDMEKLYRKAIQGYKDGIRRILTKHTEHTDATMLEFEELFVEYTKSFEEDLKNWKKPNYKLEDLLKGQSLVNLLKHYKKMRDNLDKVSWNADWSIDPKLIFSED